MIVRIKNTLGNLLADIVAGFVWAAGIAVFLTLPTVTAIFAGEFLEPYLIGNHPSDEGILWLGIPAIVFTVACLQVKAWNGLYHVLNRWYNAGATES